MEKLTPKHNHTLTDIVKVGIFAIILLLPFIVFAPSLLYFGFNKEANAPTKEAEIKEIVSVDFNQKIKNGDFATNTDWVYNSNNSVQYLDHEVKMTTNSGWTDNTYFNQQNQYYTTHKYYVSFMLMLPTIPQGTYGYSRVQNYASSYYQYTNFTANSYSKISYIFTSTFETTTYVSFGCRNTQGNQMTYYMTNCMTIDLTKMYGSGNEPTLQEFETIFDSTYYQQTESQKMLVEKTLGTETVVDITTQVNYNWQQVWNMPILSWTNYTILLDGLKAFTGVFGIVDTCYITNLIVYELIMVGIYIVIDIVLKMFTWLTHMIGNK